MAYEIQLLIAICVAVLIAWGITALVEAERCDRMDGGYKCHGENCEGCYRRTLTGAIIWSNPQPMNMNGDADLTPWLGRK